MRVQLRRKILNVTGTILKQIHTFSETCQYARPDAFIKHIFLPLIVRHKNAFFLINVLKSKDYDTFFCRHIISKLKFFLMQTRPVQTNIAEKTVFETRLALTLSVHELHSFCICLNYRKRWHQCHFSIKNSSSVPNLVKLPLLFQNFACLC